MVGSTLVFNGQAYTVVGVLPVGFRALPGYGVAAEVYLPLSRELIPDLNNELVAAVQLVGRLHEDQALAEGRAALNAAQRRFSHCTESERWAP